MDKEREAPLAKEQQELEELGIKLPEEAKVPPEVKSFLQKVEKEPETKAGEQPSPAPPAAATPTDNKVEAVDIDVTPQKLHLLLRHHAGNAARWLGEQIRRILKMRLHRGGGQP